tara:strand:- start:396 stop:638 length:243 start_codon:yes stop_codon:yes gene_type:complete
LDKQFSFRYRELKNLQKGDLVGVPMVRFAEPPLSCMGIVLTTAEENNQTLFPSVRVYNLETNKITTEFVSSLRIISKVDK